MPKKKYLVTLDNDERQQLEALLHSGTHATRKVTRARILLTAAEGCEDNAIAFQRRVPHTKLMLVDGADHVFGVKHPYEGPSDALRTVAEAALDWFGEHLG